MLERDGRFPPDERLNADVMLVAAMVLMALGTGPGAAARASMAKVTPVAYTLWVDLGCRLRRRSLTNS